MRHLAELPPWRWGTPRFVAYMSAAIIVTSVTDQLAEFTPWEAIPVTAAIYAVPVLLITWAGRLRSGRGKGSPR